MAAKKTIEEQLADLRKRREEKIKQIALRDRAKEKKLNERLAKIQTERLSVFGREVAKLCKEQKASLDAKQVLALYEKYLPTAAPKPPVKE